MTDITSSTPSTHLAAVSSVPATSDDPRPAFDRAALIATELVAGVQPGQLDDPTPCGSMSVRELVRHLHVQFARIAAVGAPEIVAGTPLPMESEPVGDGQWAGAVAAEAGSARQRWVDDDLLEQEVTLPWLSAPGRHVLGIWLSEILVHSWDLARATGQTTDWNDADADVARAAITVELPVADRTDMWAAVVEQLPPHLADGWAAPFANAVDVPADASAIDRLVAWCGRTP